MVPRQSHPCVIAFGLPLGMAAPGEKTNTNGLQQIYLAVMTGDLWNSPFLTHPADKTQMC